MQRSYCHNTSQLSVRHSGSKRWWVFTDGKYLNNIIELLNQGKIIKAPIETEGNFTFVPDLAQATLALIKKNKTGIYNVAGEGIYSLYDAALQVAKKFGFNANLVEPVGKNYFNKKIKRPSSPLAMNKLAQEKIKMSNLEEGLNKIYD